MLRATQFAHHLIHQAVKPGDQVVDATVGNGHDTIFLAELVGPSGKVWGFDVQKAALEEASKRLAGQPQVTLFHAGHETMSDMITSATTRRQTEAAFATDAAEVELAAVMFNLGYLPGTAGNSGNKVGDSGGAPIMTNAKTTLAGLEQALAHLRNHGLITLILYSGHDGGDEEAAAVKDYACSLPASFAVNQYARINSKAPAPELIAIERLN